MLTIFYVSATFLQSWRINKICSKITEQLAQKASIAFYSLPPKSDDGFDIAFATSPLCTNRKVAKVMEILWLHDDQRGCSVRPIQAVNVTPWITFPEAPSWIPFSYTDSPETLQQHLSKRTDILHLLLETDIVPSTENPYNNLSEIIKVENYGKLLAWKVDSKLAIIIETDVENFTKLLISTFLQSNFLINDQLPLLRIESVHKEGVPQPFELLSKHLKKLSRKTDKLSKEEWEKHLEGLRAINVLASQATEFQYNKNRTDAKAGVIKPDLIPQEQQKEEQPSTSEGAAKKDKENNKITSPTKSTSSIEVKVPESPSRATNISLPNTSATSPKVLFETKPKVDSKILKDNQNLIEKEMAASKSPNESKPPQDLPKALNESRFKTSKVAETSAPPSKAITPTSATKSFLRRLSPSRSTEKPSELEKLAAVTINSQKTPAKPNTATSTSSAISSPSTSKTPNAATFSPEVGVTSTATPSKVTPSPSEETPSSSTKAKASETPSSSKTNNTSRPSLKRSKDSIKESKPLNILVYSDSRSARDSTVNTLRQIVESNMYTIYPLSSQQVDEKHWIENTALLVVCGSVISNIGEILVDYFLHGGKVLSLCSDILHFILPTYRTAEVREHELVQFSYDKWQKVKMMHHIFCYQPSPVKKHFSTESEDSTQANSRKSSIELKDLHGRSHNLDVKVLGTEETWNTPSLLLACNNQSGGKALFSQIHLETSPSQFQMDENKFLILKQSESIRLEIFADLLDKYLNINVRKLGDDTRGKCIYKQAFFLGRHEGKFELLEKLKSKNGPDNVITTPKLTMAFCGKNDTPPAANANILPILVHSCPDDFSTVGYFDTLKTNYIGRLVIYAPVVNSTMNVINHLDLTNGIAVIARQQTEGYGRSNNQWLSPMGCAMFSLQLHISLQSPLGARLPLLQHLVGLAMVNTLRSHDLYKVLDIALKWPNDVYANGLNKIGGLIVQTTILGNDAIANIGCGINLDNSKPTLCINDLINEYNNGNPQKLPKLKYEQFIALMFNEIERLVDQVQSGNFDDFYKLYYEMWLHNNQPVTISDKNVQNKEATIVGIDDHGFLKVKMANGTIETVQPDGNSFDMLKGLIVPKYY